MFKFLNLFGLLLLFGSITYTASAQSNPTFPLNGEFAVVDSLGKADYSFPFNKVKAEGAIFTLYQNDTEIESYKLFSVIENVYFVRQHYRTDGDVVIGDRKLMQLIFKDITENSCAISVNQRNMVENIYLIKK